MTHGIHNAEQYRGHAEAVVRDDFGSLNTIEHRTVSEAYRDQIDRISSATKEENNRLRLAIYANLIDTNNVGNIIVEREWILNNVQATQVLINTIEPNALRYWVDVNGVKNNDGRGTLKTGEDGIYGEMTQRCVLAIFGLNVPVPVRTAPVVPPVTGAVTSSLRPVPRPTDSVEVPVEGIIISPELLANRELMDRIRQAGITINGNRAEIENPRMLEHFEEYLDLLNFIEDVPRESSNGEVSGLDNKNKLIDNYVKLINEGTDFLTEDLKEVLKYKYAEAIYNDVIRMGGYITEVEDGTTGEYTITDIQTGEVMQDNPYMRVLSESNTRNLLDVAMVISIVRDNFSLNESAIVGDASLIRALLEQHEITNPTNGRLIEAEHLLLNRDYVLNQIDNKLEAVSTGGETSAQAYQELEFLRRYVEKGETPRVNYMRTILTQVNEYKGFLDHQATIDGDWSPEDFAHASEEDMTDRIASAIKGNKLGLIVIGIIAWLMGYKKVALGTLGLGIFSGTVGDIIHGAGKAALTETDLELVRIGDVNYTLENDTYQAGYQALAERNRANMSQVIDSNNTTLPVITNDTLFNMVNDLTQDDLGISIEGDISDIVSQIQTEYTNADGTPKYTREEIEAFVALVKQGEKPEGATTISDYLVIGENLLTQSYSPKDFTVDPVFNTALNNHFLTRWEANSPNESVTREQARNGREDIQALIELTENTLSNGIFNGLTDSIFSLDIDKLNRGIPEQITDIRTLIATINAMPGLSDATKNPLTADNQILPNLIKYLEITQELKALDIANGPIASLLSQLPPSATAAEKQERIDLLNDAITKLSPSAFELNGETIDLTANPVFAALIVEVDEIRAKLENEKQHIETGISREVLESKQNLTDGIADFTSSGQVEFIIPILENNYMILQDAWDEVKDSTPIAGTPESELRTLLEPLFETGGTIETLKIQLSTAFTNYFTENQRVINDEISIIPSSYSNVTTALSSLNTLRNIEGEFNEELGIMTRFSAFIRGTDPLSKTEQLYKTTREIFPGFSVSNDNATLYGIAQEAVNKESAIALEIYNYVIGLNLSTISASDFAGLDQMRSLDIVEFVANAQPNSNFENVFAQKYSQAVTLYLQAIPTTRDGITELRNFESLYINPDPSIIDWVAGIWSSDSITPAFNTQVSIIANAVLRNDFTEDRAGLRAIIDFKNTSVDIYSWINDKVDSFESNYLVRVKTISEKTIENFEDSFTGLNDLISFKSSSEYTEAVSLVGRDLENFYEAKLESIREHIITTTSTKDTSLIITGTSTLNDIIDTHAQRTINHSSSLRTFVLPTRNRTIGELINEFDINAPITGTYPTTNGADEDSRRAILIALETLNLK